MMKAYDDEDDYEFTEEEIKQFDERYERWLRGESKACIWEEAKALILQK